jgi:long-chain fatty acid transport protein
MRKRIFCSLLATALMLVVAGGAYAAGFNIYEAGARATALGCAFTATADDGSALFYNAAGLSFQDGSSVNLNVMPVMPNFKFTEADDPAGSPASGEAEKKVFPVPGAYYTHNNGGKVAFGIGAYAPFGLGVVWDDPESWIGRQASYDVAIETIYVTPAVSFLVADGLAVAVGVDVATQHLDLNRMTLDPTTGGNAIDTNISGRSNLNVTPTFGLMYRPNDKLSFGAMYHHEKTMKYEDGDAVLTNIGAAGTPSGTFASTILQALGGTADGLESKVASELNLPWMLSLGASAWVTPDLRAEVNYVRYGWSSFESLTLDAENDNLDQELHFNYEDSWQIRVGAEYLLNEKVDLMVGYVHDKTPQPLAAVSPILPDSDRNDYSVGLRYRSGAWDFVGSYMVVVGTERTNIENGEAVRNSETYPVGSYKSLANIFGFGVGYHF